MTNFEYIYKYELNDSGHLKKSRTNVLYAPSICSATSTFRMDWDKDTNYQPQPREYEISDWFLNREIENLEKFQGYKWCPNIINYSLQKRQIYLELDGISLNYLIFKNRTLEQTCPDWKEQIRKIITEIEEAGYYKIALYPHCFFLSKDNTIKTIDFYSCVSEDNRYIPMSRIYPIIGTQSEDRYNKSTVDDNLDTMTLYNVTKETHLDKVWHDNPLK